MDDADVRALAAADPQGFVEGQPGLFVIDEIQRAPELLLAIKATVDRQPWPGGYPEARAREGARRRAWFNSQRAYC